MVSIREYAFIFLPHYDNRLNFSLTTSSSYVYNVCCSLQRLSMPEAIWIHYFFKGKCLFILSNSLTFECSIFSLKKIKCQHKTLPLHFSSLKQTLCLCISLSKMFIEDDNYQVAFVLFSLYDLVL